MTHGHPPRPADRRDSGKQASATIRHEPASFKAHARSNSPRMNVDASRSLRLAFPRLPEPLPDRQPEARQHAPALQRILLPQQADVGGAGVDLHRARLGVYIPYQSHARREVFLQLVFHLRWGITLTD